MNNSPGRTRLRFGVFTIEPDSGEVWKHGVPIRLHDKPFQVLRALLERPDEIVTRKELQDRLWPGDTVVEFENGLNNAISRLRETIGDSADSSRFIETVPRRGYRFIAPVETIPPVRVGGPDEQAGSATAAPRRRGARRALAVTALAVVAGVGAGLSLYSRSPFSPARIDSLAVLPFVTAANASERDDYIAFGMTEALIAELSRVGDLKVISQTSILRYQEARKPLIEIARELAVGAVVEGSVVDEGASVRITVQLIDAASDTHVWAETYRRPADGILATQGALAQSVAREIYLRLSGGTAPPPLASRSVDNPRAHEAYLKGRHFLQRRGEESMARAREYFEEAVAADPAHARALAGLADYYTLTDSIPPSEAQPKARAYATEAIEKDDGLAAAHVALGYIHYYADWDWAASEREFRRALDIDPGDSLAHQRYARLLGTLGRADEARAHMERALLLDPLSMTVLDAAAALCFNLRDYDRMIQLAHRILELDSRDHRGFEHLTIAYLHKGDHERALSAAEEGRRLLPGEPLFFMLAGIVQHRRGRASESAQILGLVDVMDRQGYVPAVFRAIVAAQTGRVEHAVAELEKAHAARDPYLVLLRVNPWFDPLRQHPRFVSLVRQLRFPGT